MKSGIKLVAGVGINDADYVVNPTVNGKRESCPFYLTWNNMLQSCYKRSLSKAGKSYAGCTVYKEWLTFSNFKGWMEKQDWEGKEIDKDLLCQENKIYSPENCVFIDVLVNKFIASNWKGIELKQQGVSWHVTAKKYQARCGNPFTKKEEHLGLFLCRIEANQAWKKRKHELACQLADLQTDKRVANALRIRYL